MITVEKHRGIQVLRDDLLVGGTKSVILPALLAAQPGEEYVYASPVYGGFQIALAAYCQQVGKQATIFCAERKKEHPNTLRCRQYGAKVVSVPYGYLTVVEKRARDYCAATGAIKLPFGADTPLSRQLLTERVQAVMANLQEEPEEVWCAVGSGVLVECLLAGTTVAHLHGVQVGAEYQGPSHPRLTIHKYHRSFEQPSTMTPDFPSMANYDLKAWEYCCQLADKSKRVLFWNVL